MTTATASLSARSAFLPNWPKRFAFLGLALYVLYALSTLQFTWERFVRGLDQGAKFLDRLWPPNFAADKLVLMNEGLLESVQIAVLATTVGIILTLAIPTLFCAEEANIPLKPDMTKSGRWASSSSRLGSFST